MLRRSIYKVKADRRFSVVCLGFYFRDLSEDTGRWRCWPIIDFCCFLTLALPTRQDLTIFIYYELVA